MAVIRKNQRKTEVIGDSSQFVVSDLDAEVSGSGSPPSSQRLQFKTQPVCIEMEDMTVGDHPSAGDVDFSNCPFCHTVYDVFGQVVDLSLIHI